jgi:hypothetical protein
MKGLPARVPAVVVLAGTGLAAALLAASSRRYPGVFQLSGAGVVLALTVAALLGYAACGIWALRGEAQAPPPDDTVTGLGAPGAWVEDLAV